MDPVSNANRIAQILRQRLLERAGGRPSAPAPGAQAGRADPLRELARAEGTPDRLLKRALVQSILDDQFSADVVGQARLKGDTHALSPGNKSNIDKECASPFRGTRFDDCRTGATAVA